MSRAFPEGTPIGRIETSLDWLLSHTSRFQGAIVIRIDTGEGVILIEYGRPAAFFFRVGKRVIQGDAARRLFSQHRSIRASLHRYTDQEFREALALLGPGARITGPGEKAEELPTFMTTFSKEERTRAGRASQSRSAGLVDGHPDHIEHEPAVAAGSPTGAAAPLVPVQENSPEGVLDRIVYTPGVSSVAIFREGSIVDSRGDDFLHNLVEPAEEILLSVFEVLPLLSTGPLVQVTIRLFGRNVTIAPFNDGYLLVLTNPEVNLGQIRKMVHDVAQTGTA
jgi:hypothetical protein